MIFDAVGYLKDLGVASIAAAGNIFSSVTESGMAADLYGKLDRPACVSNVIAVGALTDRVQGNPPLSIDDVAVNAKTTNANPPTYFSTKSNLLLDLWAPGSRIRTVHATGNPVYSGTSFAVPHVAGVWARLKGKYGNIFDVDTILDALKNTCETEIDPRNGVERARVCIHPDWQ